MGKLYTEEELRLAMVKAATEMWERCNAGQGRGRLIEDIVAGRFEFVDASFTWKTREWR